MLFKTLETFLTRKQNSKPLGSAGECEHAKGECEHAKEWYAVHLVGECHESINSLYCECLLQSRNPYLAIISAVYRQCVQNRKLIS